MILRDVKFHNIKHLIRFGLRKNGEVLVSAHNFAKLGMQKLKNQGIEANEP